MPKLKLEVGSFGEEVKDLHRNLTKHGFAIPSGEVNRAFFGPFTRDAVIQWQRNHGFPVSGIVDERTNARLEAAPQSVSFQPPSYSPIAPPLPAAPGAAPTGIFAREIREIFAQARDAPGKRKTKKGIVKGTGRPAG